MSMRINKITGQIKIVTGLHIGAGNDEVHIGGVDSEVVRDPLTELPYIPGSSIKGKMRTLLELSEGSITSDGKPSSIKQFPNSLIPILFGDMTSDELTRLLFRDAKLSSESINTLNSLNILPTEEKHENTINRLNGVANPRNIERVISGLVFDFEIILRVFNEDDENKFLEMIKMGITLLQLDALGGHGSRGYGKVEFINLKYNGESFSV
ncbi:type III-A CRISPR-associated RAMP protein Csm3 [Spirochaetales bacterium NM-380-WT-3C1]|uniref:CRISPR system Cms endoribonuclease Csm3 n=1 Tax=Bullifex porci TaxID=2606638 RepID=A0A7X2PBN3_9SPIO|nr:type III-A CRISPR-associated RAMP protein Csm3 [Bullifex porci]MSU05909.1 type III-A CRISPR-associated RAMP protein Csm3 [Bullifex porci]